MTITPPPKTATSRVVLAVTITLAVCGCLDRRQIPVDPIERDAQVLEHGEVPVAFPPVFAIGGEIRGVTIVGNVVYWTEFGTRDELGNYNHDGVLRSKSVDGGRVVTLATGLDGPATLRATATHVVVELTEVPSPSGPSKSLVRVDVETGETLDLPTWYDGYYPSLAATDSRIVWTAGRMDTICSIGSAETTSTCVPETAWGLLADGADVYVIRDYAYPPRWYRFSGSAPSTEPQCASTEIAAGECYYVDRDNFVTRVDPVSGPRRIATIAVPTDGGNSGVDQLEVFGHRFVVRMFHSHEAPNPFLSQLVVGDFDRPTTTSRASPFITGSVLLWATSATHLVYVNGTSIYVTPWPD